MSNWEQMDWPERIGTIMAYHLLAIAVVGFLALDVAAIYGGVVGMTCLLRAMGLQ